MKIATLEIFGQIDEAYRQEFYEALYKNQEFVAYNGVIDASQSTQALKDSYMLLFPTYYPGEGLAGTIIDAYAAGVPVLASDWRYNSEVVEDGYTGILYETHNNRQLLNGLIYSVLNPDIITKMKYNCIKEAMKYTIDAAKIAILSNL